MAGKNTVNAHFQAETINWFSNDIIMQLIANSKDLKELFNKSNDKKADFIKKRNIYLALYYPIIFIGLILVFIFSCLVVFFNAKNYPHYTFIVTSLGLSMFVLSILIRLLRDKKIKPLTEDIDSINEILKTIRKINIELYKDLEKDKDSA